MEYKQPTYKTYQFQGMVTSSAKMLEFFETLKRVSRTNSPVLIRGESGTGKELVARAIHNLSPRKSNAFNAVNCAMLTPELVNSELFGHVKGSFTGAVTDHKGYFEESHKGTLFLDEVAELPLSAQSRLLRVLQEKTFTKLGSTKSNFIDVRLLSATHKSLRSETKMGNFREDLMYRLRVVPIFLPRLVERDHDIEILVWKFIEEFNQIGFREIKAIEGAARDALLNYSWPGNIRELRNNIEYAFAIGDGLTLTLSDLTPELQGKTPQEERGNENISLDYLQEERHQMMEALNEAKGSKSKAAEILGMSRSTLWRKMKVLGINHL